MLRLETLSPRLVAELTTASTDKRRAAVVASCRHAIMTSSVLDPVAARVLRDLGVGLRIPDETIVELKVLQEQAEDLYFEHADRNDAAQGKHTLAAFARARALSSLLFAASGDSLEAACDAIYDAIFSVDNQTAAILLVSRELNDDQS